MELHDAYMLARDLLELHGLGHWNITFDRARRRAGLTNYNTSTISLSRPLTLLFDPDDVREVILHEIAHALVGSEHAHDAVWKAEAARIGATPSASLKNTPQIPHRYIGVCPAGHVLYRHRRTRKLVSCAACSPVFDVDNLIMWYDTEQRAA